MTADQIATTLATLKSCPSVSSISAWQGRNGKRHYLNLVGCNARYKGDTSTKVYLDETAGELRFEVGKGSSTHEFLASFEALKTAAAQLGTARTVSFDMVVTL